MYDDYEDDGAQIIALEPGAYSHAVGLAMGSAEVLREEGLFKYLTLMFLDCEGSHVPILISLDSQVLEYLLSEKFQKDLHDQVSEIA